MILLFCCLLHCVVHTVMHALLETCSITKYSSENWLAKFKLAFQATKKLVQVVCLHLK